MRAAVVAHNYRVTSISVPLHVPRLLLLRLKISVKFYCSNDW